MIRRLLACLSLCAALLLPAVARGDETPRIAVISATEAEWRPLLASLSERREHRSGGTRFATGKLRDKAVVLVLGGVGPVNAAMAAQRTIDLYRVRAIVFSGIAGGVDPALAIGDVVVAGQWGSYLASVFARQDGNGFALPAGKTTPFPNFGMIFPRGSKVLPPASPTAERRFWFPADPGLLDLVRRLAPTLTLESCTAKNRCLPRPPRVEIGGNGVSGPAFVDNAEFRDYAFRTFQAHALDMESAAVAQVAYVNDVPFVAVRGLSDLAGGDTGENQIRTFFALAAINAARTAAALVEAMP